MGDDDLLDCLSRRLHRASPSAGKASHTLGCLILGLWAHGSADGLALKPLASLPWIPWRNPTLSRRCRCRRSHRAGTAWDVAECKWPATRQSNQDMFVFYSERRETPYSGQWAKWAPAQSWRNTGSEAGGGAWRAWRALSNSCTIGPCLFAHAIAHGRTLRCASTPRTNCPLPRRIVVPWLLPVHQSRASSPNKRLYDAALHPAMRLRRERGGAC